MAKPANDLRDCLTGIELILSRAGIFGGNEVERARDLGRRIKRLLSPEPAEPLIAEARAFVAQLTPYIEARKQQARAHEEAQERASAEHAEHYAAKSTIIREQRKRIEDAIERNNAKAAVAEVIG